MSALPVVTRLSEPPGWRPDRHTQTEHRRTYGVPDPLTDIRVTRFSRAVPHASPAPRRAPHRDRPRLSPNHDGLADPDTFLLRGTFADRSLDVVFVVERDRTV